MYREEGSANAKVNGDYMDGALMRKSAQIQVEMERLEKLCATLHETAHRAEAQLEPVCRRMPEENKSNITDEPSDSSPIANQLRRICERLSEVNMRFNKTFDCLEI